MAVAHHPTAVSARPFTAVDQQVVRQTMDSLNAPAEAVYYTYLIRQHVMSSTWSIKTWRSMLVREILAVRPRAVILYGQDTLTDMFLDVDRSKSFEEMRHTRYACRRTPEASFFVTHDPRDVGYGDRLDEAVKNEWDFDHIAVVSRVQDYYRSAEVLK